MECGLTPKLFGGRKEPAFTMAPSVALPALYREAVRSFASGKSAEMVLDDLVDKGVLERYARTLMAAALSESRMIDSWHPTA